MKTEIYIENQRLDITEGISSLITYALDDIKDFASRNTNFSKTIVLPGTANNNYLFGHTFDVRILNSFNPLDENVGLNYNAAKSALCVMFQDHIQVFKGVIRVMKIIITNGIPEYEAAVFGELGGLISSIGNRKLQDLDFSAYDQAWVASGVTASWPLYNQGSGVYFPVIDHGGVSVDKIDYDIRAMRPALFVKEYLDKIIEQAGYSYSSDLFNTSRFKSLIVPHNKKVLTNDTSELLDASRSTSQTVIDFGSSSVGNITFPTVDTSIFTPAGSPASAFTFAGADPTAMTLSWTLNYRWSDTGNNMAVKLFRNATQIAVLNPFFTGGSLQSGAWTSSVDVTLNPGDVISFEVSVASSATPYTFIADTMTFEIDSLAVVPVPVTVGDVIEINDSIPRNVLQKDFFSSIIKLFNLYVYEDKLKTKFLYITPYVDFYNASGVTDWTYKLDRSKAIELTPMSELNSRFYNFSFKPDSDYYNDLYKNRYNEVYGDYLYDSEFEFANEKSDIPLIFSPSVLVGYTGADKIVTALYKLNSGVEEKMDTNIRILQALNVTGVTSWDILDDVSVLQAGLTNYGYAGHYNDPDAPANDIHFGVPRELFFTLATGAINVTQFNVYWSPYMAEITDKDSKLLEAWFKLSSKDIYDLNFALFVYIDGAYWRLNKITDWNASTPDICKCSLLKVINTFY